jgi:hypothetical protein
MNNTTPAPAAPATRKFTIHVTSRHQCPVTRTIEAANIWEAQAYALKRYSKYVTLRVVG